MKTAIITDWLLTYRGGERVLQSLISILPDPHIYTIFYKPENDRRLAELTRNVTVHPSFLNKVPILSSKWRWGLFLYPRAIQQFNLEGYDLIISLHHCVAKGVKTPSHTPHLAYIFTPMRYLWLPHLYFQNPLLSIWSCLSYPLKKWDIKSNRNITRFFAISGEIQERIHQFYNQQSEILYPPVDTAFFYPTREKGDFFLSAGHLVPYKRMDIAVRCFSQNGLPLKIVGNGPEYKRLKKMAGSNIEFTGKISDSDLRELYSRARAFIFPGHEDFGLVPLEAMACGTPAIGYGKGGLCETITPETGILFTPQTVNALQQALEKFFEKEKDFDRQKIREHVVQNFGREIFLSRWRKIIKQFSPFS